MMLLLLAVAAFGQDLGADVGNYAGPVGGLAGGVALLLSVVDRLGARSSKADDRIDKLTAEVHRLALAFARLETELRWSSAGNNSQPPEPRS